VNPAWVSAVVALAAALTAVLVWLARVGWKLYKKTDAFLEDWNGSVASPGHPRRPGVMERLVELESSTTGMNGRFDSQDAALADIKQEVMYNSGHSLKDTVVDVRSTIRDIIVRLDKFDPPSQLTGRK
jgi:hypothetical protein